MAKKAKDVGETAPQKRPKEANLMPPWQPGQSGNPAGRPRGIRNKLMGEFLTALQNDFLTHGPATVQLMRNKAPARYLEMICRILPQEHGFDEDTSENFIEILKHLGNASKSKE